MAKKKNAPNKDATIVEEKVVIEVTEEIENVEKLVIAENTVVETTVEAPVEEAKEEKEENKEVRE